MNSTPTSGVNVFPPYGCVRLLQWSGTELDIVNAARVSFHKESKEFEDGDKGLLRFLLKNKHGTPFEQGFLSHWHIRVPLFVMREWIRHRVGFSYNEESGRYVELRGDFYQPESDNIRTQVGKPGAYSFEPVDRPTASVAQQIMYENSRRAFADYEALLSLGIAKEQARTVLNLNLFTEFRWTANARSLMNFLALRNAPDAMLEIRKYAEAIEGLFAQNMPTIHEAFVSNGRVAP